MSTRDAKHVVQLTVLVLMFLDIAIFTGLYESDVSSVRSGDLCNLRFFQWWSPPDGRAPWGLFCWSTSPRVGKSEGHSGISEGFSSLFLFSFLVAEMKRNICAKLYFQPFFLFISIFRTLPGVLSVLVLFLLVLFLFAMMFFKLFSNKKIDGVPVFQKIDGQPYFAVSDSS